jgi:superfamily II DNA helicase RecQ
LSALGITVDDWTCFDATAMRMNLHLAVSHAHDRSQALSIASICIMDAATDTCTLVYCRTKADCDLCCEAFSMTLPSLRCVVYHAGLTPVLRKQILLDVQRGSFPTVVCTVAFGLGIDIENICALVSARVCCTVSERGRKGRQTRATCSVCAETGFRHC